jgi:hypothetical protein
LSRWGVIEAAPSPALPDFICDEAQARATALAEVPQQVKQLTEAGLLHLVQHRGLHLRAVGFH